MKDPEQFFSNPKYAEYWSAKVRHQGYEESYRKDFLENLRVHPGERVLEIGTGEGRNLSELISANVTYVGIDISRQMLKLARQRLAKDQYEGVNLVVCHALWLPFRELSFDKVLCFATIFFVGDQLRSIDKIQSMAKTQIAIELRNSRNPNVFFYILAGNAAAMGEPIFRRLFRRSWFRRILAFSFGESRAERLANQILTYGSLQPVFAISSATVSREITRRGWRIQSLCTYSLTAPSANRGRIRNLVSGTIPKPAIVVHAVRTKSVQLPA